MTGKLLPSKMKRHGGPGSWLTTVMSQVLVKLSLIMYSTFTYRLVSTVLFKKLRS